MTDQEKKCTEVFVICFQVTISTYSKAKESICRSDQLNSESVRKTYL